MGYSGHENVKVNRNQTLAFSSIVGGIDKKDICIDFGQVFPIIAGQLPIIHPSKKALASFREASLSSIESTLLELRCAQDFFPGVFEDVIEIISEMKETFLSIQGHPPEGIQYHNLREILYAAVLTTGGRNLYDGHRSWGHDHGWRMNHQGFMQTWLSHDIQLRVNQFYCLVTIGKEHHYLGTRDHLLMLSDLSSQRSILLNACQQTQLSNYRSIA